MATTLYKSGPGRVEFNGTKLFSKGNIVIRFEPTINSEELLCFPDIASMDNVEVTVSFTPAGNVTAATMAVYVGDFLSLVPGDCLLGDLDQPLVVHFKDGDKFTFHNGVPLAPAPLTYRRGAGRFGEIRFGLLRDRDAGGAFKAWSEADSLVTKTTEAYPADDASFFDVADVSKACATMTWIEPIAGAAVADIETKDGVSVAFPTRTSPVEFDCPGVINYRLESIGVEATATPMLDDSEKAVSWLRVQGAGAAIGRVLDGKALTTDQTDLAVTPADGSDGLILFGAELVSSGLQASKRDPRFGEFKWRATGSGGAYPLATLD